jgi:hypothetical protein
MSTKLKIFWLVVWVGIALLAFDRIARCVHITIEFGAPREPALLLQPARTSIHFTGVEPRGSRDSDLGSASARLLCKSEFLPRIESPAVIRMVQLTPDHSAALLGVTARRNPLGWSMMPARSARFRIVSGRASLLRAKSDAGLTGAQSCRAEPARSLGQLSALNSLGNV